jgi:hypothetical protein
MIMFKIIQFVLLVLPLILHAMHAMTVWEGFQTQT